MLKETSRDQNGLLRIGEFAKLAGTNLRTLRYYEEIGLFEPAARSEGGFRFYRATDVHRLRMAQSLQELGLPLERICELMRTRSGGETETGTETELERVRSALQAQEELLDQRLGDLQAQREATRRALTKLEECACCGHRPGPENNHCEPCLVDGKPLPKGLSALF